MVAAAALGAELPDGVAEIHNCFNFVGSRGFCPLRRLYLPEEVVFAVDVAVSDEAPLGEDLAAVRALETFCVPILLEDSQHKAIEDEEAAAHAFGDRG